MSYVSVLRLHAIIRNFLLNSRRSVSTVLAQLGNENSANDSSDGSTLAKPKNGPIKPRTQLVISDSESEADSSDNEENESLAVLRFLAAFKLEDYYPMYGLI